MDEPKLDLDLILREIHAAAIGAKHDTANLLEGRRRERLMSQGGGVEARLRSGRSFLIYGPVGAVVAVASLMVLATVVGAGVFLREEIRGGNREITSRMECANYLYYVGLVEPNEARQVLLDRLPLYCENLKYKIHSPGGGPK